MRSGVLRPQQWFREVADYLRAWAWRHRDGRYDTWTQRDA